MLGDRRQPVHDTDPVGVGLHVGSLSGMSSGERVTVGVEVDPADPVGTQGVEGSQVVGVRVEGPVTSIRRKRTVVMSWWSVDR